MGQEDVQCANSKDLFMKVRGELPDIAQTPAFSIGNEDGCRSEAVDEILDTQQVKESDQT